MNSKIELGQFYTRNNPFQFERFSTWLRNIPNLPNAKFIEPFGGSNSIVQMILETFPEIQTSQWSSFDIHPEAQQENLVPEIRLVKRDTIKNFPAGFSVCITNPPYLAKNSATRKGLSTDFGNFQDLFEVSLSKMLENTPYVAAIIPESFITRKIFQDRLEFVISLNFQMFDDTEFPVCLAVFSPQTTPKFEIWRGSTLVAEVPELDSKISNVLMPVVAPVFRFNDPAGPIGLNAIDGTKEASIRFRDGREIASENIKVSSRSLTRISSKFLNENPDALPAVIEEANRLLTLYREITNDVYLTSFKGLRSDGMYRRRLDWRIAGQVLGTAIVNLHPNLANTILETPKLV
jgi:hypothetical protein